MSSKPTKRSSCRSIRLTPGKKHYFKSHFTGAAREVIGYYELLAAKDPERFVWCSVADIIEHCKRYGTKVKYSERAVRRVRWAAEKAGILVPAERDRHGVRSGYIFNGCPELCGKTFDGWCDIAFSFVIKHYNGKTTSGTTTRTTNPTTKRTTTRTTTFSAKNDHTNDQVAPEKIAASAHGGEGYEQSSAMSRDSRVLSETTSPTPLPSVTKKAGEGGGTIALSYTGSEGSDIEPVPDLTKPGPFMAELMIWMEQYDLPTDIAAKYQKAAFAKATEVGVEIFFEALEFWLDAKDGKKLCKGFNQPLYKFLDCGYADLFIPFIQECHKVAKGDVWKAIYYVLQYLAGPPTKGEAERIGHFLSTAPPEWDRAITSFCLGVKAAQGDLTKFLDDPEPYVRKGWHTSAQLCIPRYFAEGRRPDQRPDDDPYWKELAAKERLAEEVAAPRRFAAEDAAAAQEIDF
jgi:hypothetical protein